MMKAELKESGKLYISKKTIDQVYTEFLEIGSENYQENTIYGTKSYYKKYIRNSFENIAISELDYPTLQKYFNSLENEIISTNLHIKSAFNRIIVYAIRAGYIKINLLTYVTVKGKDTYRETNNVLSLDDSIAIIDGLKEKNKFRYDAYAIAQIGYCTGLRVSEIFALAKTDIDFDNNEIHVNKKLVYNGLKKVNSIRQKR